MKLLDWMHRKFRQNASDVLKDISIGRSCNCLSGHHQFSPEVSPVVIPRIHCPAKEQGRHSCNDFVFEGLLTIGTLGSIRIQEEEEEASMEESAVAIIEAIAEKEEAAATTENDLMVVSAELEKVFMMEAEKEANAADRLSSARPSKASECPLQDYLFGVGSEERKEKRASLEELFMIEEGNGSEGKKERGREGSGEGKVIGTTAVQVMVKKMLKKCGGSRRGGGSLGSDGAAAATTTTAKLNKIMQIFHKKVYPEGTVSPKKSTKSNKHERKDSNALLNKGNGLVKNSGNNANVLLKESRRFCNKEDIERLQCISDPPLHLLTSCDIMKVHEYWDMSDDDYLVLEL